MTPRQPIETAPRDGTWIRAWPEDDRVFPDGILVRWAYVGGVLGYSFVDQKGRYGMNHNGGWVPADLSQ